MASYSRLANKPNMASWNREKLLDQEDNFNEVISNVTNATHFGSWIKKNTDFASYTSGKISIMAIIRIFNFILCLYLLIAMLHFYDNNQSRRRFCYIKSIDWCGWTKRCILLAVILQIVASACSNVTLVFDYWKFEHCTTPKILVTILGISTNTAVLTSLWCRQRMVYCAPLLRKLTNRITRRLSIVGGTLTVIYPILIAPLILSMGSSKKCLNNYLHTGARRIILTVAFVRIFENIILLGLFFYPLLRYRKERKEGEAGSSALSYAVPLIKRSFFVSVVFFVVKVMVTLLNYSMVYEWYDFPAVALTNQTIKVFGSVLSFSEWKTILLPWKKCEGDGTHEDCNMATLVEATAVKDTNCATSSIDDSIA